MKNKMKYLALALAVLMFAGALAACNTNPGTATTAGGSSATTASSGSSTTAAATQGGNEDEYKVLRYGVSSYNGMHMPIMTDNVYDSQFCNLVFEALVDLDMEGAYVPELAESWELSNNNHTYTFKLFPGTAFSDGTPLTSADIKFTYEMIADPGYNGPRAYVVNLMEGYDAYHAGTASEMTGIKIIDDRTISFTFTDGNAGPANIEYFGYGIMNKAYYEAANWDEFITKLSVPGEAGGSGPLMLVEYKPKEMVRFVKNENYWNIANQEIKIDEVLCLEVPNENIIAALSTDQIDFGETGVNMDNLGAMQAAPGVTPYNFLANGYTFMCFNCTNGIFDVKEVRQAFLYALDRKSFIKAEYGDLAAVGLTPISPVSWAFPDTSDMNPYDFDLAKADELLTGAGWVMGSDGIRYKDGQKLTVRWLVYTDSSWPGTLSGMASDSWKQAGIDLVIELMDFNTVSEKTMEAPIGEKDFDIYTMGFSLSVDPDPKGGLFDADTYGAGGYDASGYYNEYAQSLIAKGRSEFDQDKRAEVYKEWGILMNEEVPTTIVAYRNYLWGFRDRLQGMNITALCDWSYSIFNIDLVD